MDVASHRQASSKVKILVVFTLHPVVGQGEDSLLHGNEKCSHVVAIGDGI